MKRFGNLLFFSLLFIAFSCSTSADKENIGNIVKVNTSEGSFEIFLFNETPKHKENFIGLATSNFYDSILFHRVIKNFVIQAGDPLTKQAKDSVVYGSVDRSKKIIPEIMPTKFSHIKGAVGAAREGDHVNPDRLSSGTHFYIVLGGIPVTEEIIYTTEQRIENKLDSSVVEVYKRDGGAPHLDGAYTVFGYVCSGMDVVEKISLVETGEYDKPKSDIQIISTEVIKLNEAEIAEKYNNYAK